MGIRTWLRCSSGRAHVHKTLSSSLLVQVCVLFGTLNNQGYMPAPENVRYELGDLIYLTYPMPCVIPWNPSHAACQ